LGSGRKGYQRLLHANAICLTGVWEITAETARTPATSRTGAAVCAIARYSTCCTETRRGNTRSLSMVGRVYPTTDPEHAERPADGQLHHAAGHRRRLQQKRSMRQSCATPRTRPSSAAASASRRCLASGAAFNRAETKPTIRQVYQIGGKIGPPSRPADARAGVSCNLSVVPEQPSIPGEALDFRDEIMAQIYDRGDPQPKRTLTFRIETSDEGVTLGNPFKERREFKNWRPIGTLTFNAAVASYNGDHVFHIHHPPRGGTIATIRGRRTK